jgi:hypothetical protein
MTLASGYLVYYSFIAVSENDIGELIKGPQSANEFFVVAQNNNQLLVNAIDQGGAYLGERYSILREYETSSNSKYS